MGRKRLKPEERRSPHQLSLGDCCEKSYQIDDFSQYFEKKLAQELGIEFMPHPIKRKQIRTKRYISLPNGYQDLIYQKRLNLSAFGRIIVEQYFAENTNQDSE